MVSCLHQLIQIAVHVFHAYVQLLAVGVKENIEGSDEVSMEGKRLEEDNLSQLEAWRKRVEGLLHRFDGDLPMVSIYTTEVVTLSLTMVPLLAT